MDDDGGDWFTDGPDEAPPPVPVSAGGGGGGGEEDTPAPEGAPPGAEQVDTQELPEDDYLDPNKLLLCKHWIRPKFLQYKYLYDYRHNYYDDVIDFLDKRQRGLHREIPHPQTWAERALRTYNSQINRSKKFRELVDDTALVTKTKISGSFQLHHSKSYISRRYSSILF